MSRVSDHQLLQQYEIALLMLWAAIGRLPGELSQEQLDERVRAVEDFRAKLLRRLGDADDTHGHPRS